MNGRYKVLELGRETASMLIEWDTGEVLNHHIPSELIGNRFATTGEVDALIEAMRPEPRKVTKLPTVLEQMANSK